MKITADTKIADLIRENKDAIETIASINPHFVKLRNPVLRKLFASRVTIREAARIGGCTVSDFFVKLKEIGFEPDEAAEHYSGPQVTEPGERTSGAHGDFKVVMDVRQDLAEGKDPFNKIMQAVKTLQSGETMLIINTFDPLPLRRILTAKGYTCSVERKDGLVHTTIVHSGKKTEAAPELNNSTNHSLFEEKMVAFGNKLLSIDVSNLEMPGPMVEIMNTLNKLPAGHALLVRHRKYPQFLIAELEQQQMRIIVHQHNESSFEFLIYQEA